MLYKYVQHGKSHSDKTDPLFEQKKREMSYLPSATIQMQTLENQSSFFCLSSASDFGKILDISDVSDCFDAPGPKFG